MKRVITTCIGLALSVTSMLGQTEIKHNSYLELNGKNQCLRISTSPQLNMLLGQSYTYTFWMSADRTMIYGDSFRILSKRDLSNKVDSLNRSGYEIMAFRTTANNFLAASLPNGAGLYNQSIDAWGASPEGAYLRTWYHGALVVNRANSTIKLFVDGKEVLSKDKDIRAWVADNQLPLYIGAGSRDNKPMGFFSGRLDNVRLYNKALSTEELLKDRATERIAPQTEGLVAAFDFDGLKPGATTYTDKTGKFTAELIGFPQSTGHALVASYSEQRSNGQLIGRGANQAISTFCLGLEQPSRLEDIEVLTPEASQKQNITRYRLYKTDNGDRFDPRTAPHTLVAEGKPNAGGITTLKAVKNTPLISKYDHLWLVADVASTAQEGDEVSTEIKCIKLAGASAYEARPVRYTHEIVLQRTLVWTPGENQSAHYRIPAIVRLNNGNLVASIDKRKTTDNDLPSNIDIEVKISRDNGRTWSKPITVAKGTAEHGYGDAAITTDGKNIYMVMVAGSGLWHYPSQAKKPLEMYFSKSSDGGLTWTPVKNITEQVYTDKYPNGGFFGSGNGIITSKGRIAFVAALRTEAKWGGRMDNVLVYSDDKGATWQASPVARVNGDESKVIELSNGDLLISSRNRAGGANARTFVLSHDHGQTWSEPKTWPELMGNACNAALTRYSSERTKGEKNILLHTLLESPSRDHLRIYMSEDEGKTWSLGKTVCDGEAAYSEVTRLKNGNVGIISEENDRPAYDIYFTEVSLNWIKQGKALKK